MAGLRVERDLGVLAESSVEIDESEDEARTATLKEPINMSYILCQ
jgi:hypothetical protein